MSSVVLQINKADVRFGDCPAAGQVFDPTALTDFSCQVTSAQISASANTTTTAVPATFCSPASESSVPVASTFTLDLEFLQDWTEAAGLSAWLFENDATEKCFALYLDGNTDPSAHGKIIVTAGAFGGAPGTSLTASATLNIQGYPVIMNKAGGSIRPIPDPLDVTLTVFPDAGTAAGFAALAALQSSLIYGTTGSGKPYNGGTGTMPAFTTGQYVGIGTNNATKVHWTGTAWASGAA